MDLRELNNFLSQAATRQTAPSEVLQTPDPPEPEELTVEENAELVQRALNNLGLSTVSSNNLTANISVDTERGESQQTEVAVEIPEPPQVDEYEGIPEEERPVEMPDYTNVKEETQRFSAATWFNKVQEKVVVLAGIGGIGSNMAVILAKLNPKALYLFDFDVVEPANMAGQFYSNEDIGMPKVDALARSIVKYTNYSSVFACNRTYTAGENIASDIMICGFDNMTARREFFEVWKDRVNSLPQERRKECLLIDGRLTANEFQIFCMTGEDDYYMSEYQNKYLFHDYQAPSLACSFKQTGYLADMIGAFMVNLFVNFCANQVNPERQMALPFLTNYKTDLMYLELRR